MPVIIYGSRLSLTAGCLNIDGLEMLEHVTGQCLLLRQTLEQHHHLVLTHCRHAFTGETPAGAMNTTVHCQQNDAILKHLMGTAIKTDSCLNFDFF